MFVISFFADFGLIFAGNQPHATAEWSPWCCWSDETLKFRHINFVLRVSPIAKPVWPLSHFYYRPEWQKTRKDLMVSPVKVLAPFPFSNSGTVCPLIPRLLFISQGGSFFSSGYKLWEQNNKSIFNSCVHRKRWAVHSLLPCPSLQVCSKPFPELQK